MIVIAGYIPCVAVRNPVRQAAKAIPDALPFAIHIPSALDLI
jgi:hypothetical protein